jgi:cell division control protein 6
MPRYAARSVFKDYAKLAFDYVPDRLPGRERQLDRLFTLYRPVLEAGVAVNAFIHGSVGTGKTHTARRFCQEFRAEAAGRDRAVEFLVVNCRQKNTPDDVTLSMIRNFQPEFRQRGFSAQEKIDAVRRELEKRRAHLLLVLDEVDVLLKRSGPDLVYSLTRLGEESSGGRERVSLLCLSQRADALASFDAATASTFRRTNVVEFARYTAAELRAILLQRCDLALHPATWDGDVVGLIAEIAAEYGDARYAIEVLQTAGALADEDQAGEIAAEHVRGAKATVHPTDVEAKVASLDRAHALVLLGIARKMRRRTYLVTGEAEEAYALACEEHGERPRGHTQFWKYLKDLEAQGLLDTRPDGGKDGKTTAIALAEVPAKLLAEELERRLRQGAPPRDARVRG